MNQGKIGTDNPPDRSDTEAARATQVRNVLQDLRRVFRSIQAHSRWVEKQCGVSSAQLWTIWELSTQPGLRVSDLSTIMSIHQSTASNMLDKLEDKGLVRRERRGPDQRVVRLYLTDKGARLLADAPRPAQGALTHALQQVSDEALEQLETGLEQLIRVMDAEKNEAGLEPLTDQDL